MPLSSFRDRLAGGLLLWVAVTICSPACAETLIGALAKAYPYDSDINSARAGVRVVDEHVPIVRSAQRPAVSGQSGYRLHVPEWHPADHRLLRHYDAMNDSWYGSSTPDGR
jgi:hypothetical protein